MRAGHNLEADQALVKEIVEQFLDLENERLGDAHDWMMGPKEVQRRAERYNYLIDVANSQWLELDIDVEPLSEQYIADLVDGAADDIEED